jgi:hypothetical protein
VRRGSRNSDADDLMVAEVMGRGDTGTRSADVKGLGELNELDAGRVDAPEEHRHLEADARGPTPLNRLYSLAFVVYFDFQAPPGSTTELVRICILDARKHVLATRRKLLSTQQVRWGRGGRGHPVVHKGYFAGYGASSNVQMERFYH